MNYYDHQIRYISCIKDEEILEYLKTILPVNE